MSKNILEFGAVGDGITDCTKALMQAAVYQGSVYFPEGTYIITRQINAGKALSWYGEGENSIIKLLPLYFENPECYKNRTVYNTTMLKMEEGEHFEIRNLTFDANKESYAKALLPEKDTNSPDNEKTRRNDHIVCIEVFGTKKLIMDGCTIKNAIIEGAYIDRTADICITRSTFSGNGFELEDASGLHILGGYLDAPAIRISDCKFDNNGFNGLLLNNVYGAVVNNISCCGNHYDGIALWNGSSRCLLSNIFCDGNRAGICFRGDDKGWQADMPREEQKERCYSTNNIINGLITLNNRSGIMWGCAQHIYIYGWICRDSYAHELFYKQPDYEIICNIYGAHLMPCEEMILDRSDDPQAFQAVIS